MKNPISHLLFSIRTLRSRQNLRHHFDGLSNLRRRQACQLLPIPFEVCAHIIATPWQKVVSRHSHDAQRRLAFFVPNLDDDENHDKHRGRETGAVG